MRENSCDALCFRTVRGLPLEDIDGQAYAVTSCICSDLVATVPRLDSLVQLR